MNAEVSVIVHAGMTCGRPGFAAWAAPWHGICVCNVDAAEAGVVRPCGILASAVAADTGDSRYTDIAMCARCFRFRLIGLRYRRRTQTWRGAGVVNFAAGVKRFVDRGLVIVVQGREDLALVLVRQAHPVLLSDFDTF